MIQCNKCKKLNAQRERMEEGDYVKWQQYYRKHEKAQQESLGLRHVYYEDWNADDVLGIIEQRLRRMEERWKE